MGTRNAFTAGGEKGTSQKALSAEALLQNGKWQIVWNACKYVIFENLKQVFKSVVSDQITPWSCNYILSGDRIKSVRESLARQGCDADFKSKLDAKLDQFVIKNYLYDFVTNKYYARSSAERLC